MIVVIISGTPGTGKTTIAKILANRIDSALISLNELISNKNFIVEYDEKRDTNVADMDKTTKYLKEKLDRLKKRTTEHVIIEGNFSDIVPNEYIDYAVVLRCNPDVLNGRLIKRGYKKEKIKENIQAEILGTCANYILEKNLQVPLLEFDTSDSDPQELADLLIYLIQEKSSLQKYKLGKIDWLEYLDDNDKFDEFFD